MSDPTPRTAILTVLAYAAATFGVQGVSHFAINADHYAAIPIMRAEPILPLGLTSMVVQGLVFAWLFPRFNRGPHPIRNGVVFSCTLGAFLGSYIVLAEAGKYAIPALGSWIAVEGAATAVQFVVFGMLLGLIHRRQAALGAAPTRAFPSVP
jgi:hypothetical protein